MNIEIREDGGDFMEIWVNGVCIKELCSDDHDLSTTDSLTVAIGKALGIEVRHDNDYEYVPNRGLVRADQVDKPLIEKVSQAILVVLKAQSNVFIDDSDGNQSVIIDGHVNVVALAQAAIDVMEPI